MQIKIKGFDDICCIGYRSFKNMISKEFIMVYHIFTLGKELKKH
jgi:hypothetical protein